MPDTGRLFRYQSLTPFIPTTFIPTAGVFKGLKASTQWLAHDVLKQFGAIPTKERVVRDGKVFTAAGVSSRIDMALTLVAEEFGANAAQLTQLLIEYDPQPPFNAGSPDRAPSLIVNEAREAFAKLKATRQ